MPSNKKGARKYARKRKGIGKMGRSKKDPEAIASEKYPK